MPVERRERILILLRTRDVGLPEPVRHVEYLKPGFVNSTVERASCEDCLANGRVLKTCETCGGHGYVERRRTVDPYDTGKRTGYSEDLLEQRRRRDSEIDLLARLTAPPRSEADLLAETPPFEWERERKKLYRDGDYAQLDRALESLRAADADAYRALHAVYVYGWMQQTTPLVETLCARGISFVDQRMPDPIRVPLRFQPDEAKGYVHRRRSSRAA